MTRKPGLFDRMHGKGAFARLCSMMDDPALSYGRVARRFGLRKQRIGRRLGISKQRVGQMVYEGAWHLLRRFGIVSD